jgi:hypothetical protein
MKRISSRKSVTGEKTPPPALASKTRKRAAGNFGAEAAPSRPPCGQGHVLTQAQSCQTGSEGVLSSRSFLSGMGFRWEKESMKKLQTLVLALLTVAATHNTLATLSMGK